jgi:hypothetical protein
MEIKVKKAVGSESKTATTLDLGLGNLPDKIQSRVKQDVGEFLVESLLSSAAKGQSSVAGEGSFDPLSPIYRKKKVAEGHAGKANLELSGDLLDGLTFEETNKGIELGWFGAEAGKADGHNNLSGKSHLPQRRLLPDVGQSFSDSIQSGAEKIIADAIADAVDFDAADFEDVETKADLYTVLDDYFPDMSRAEIKATIARTPALASLLDDQDLFKLL